jgi:hypothetical protein
MHKDEQSVPDPSPLEVEIATAKWKKYKMPGSDQIPAESIQAGEEILYVIHKLFNYVWNKEELLISGRSLLLYTFTKKGDKLTVIITIGYHCYELHIKLYPISFSQG